jgi:hypothetical protein
MILSFKNKNQEEHITKSVESMNDSSNIYNLFSLVRSRSSSPMNRSDISSQMRNINFEGTKMKLYSVDSSLILENNNLNEIFDAVENSKIKLDKSTLSNEKSRKDDFLNEIINLIETPENLNQSKNISESKLDNSKESIILNLDGSSNKNKVSKKSLSCSDLNIMIKNFDFKTSSNLIDPKYKTNQTVNNFLNGDDVKEEKSLDSLQKRKKENFIPKSEYFTKCEKDLSGNLERSERNENNSVVD